CGSRISCQCAPPSPLFQTPLPCEPTKSVPGWCGSGARHCAPLPCRVSATDHSSPRPVMRATPSPVAAKRSVMGCSPFERYTAVEHILMYGYHLHTTQTE